MGSRVIDKEINFDVKIKKKAFTSPVDSLLKNGKNSVNLNTELNEFLTGNHLEKGDKVKVIFQHEKNSD